MAATFQLRVLSHDQSIFDKPIESLIAPGIEGYLGVLAHHAPLLTTLGNGQLTIRDANEKETLYNINGGILEVNQSGAIILAEEIKPAVS